MRGTWDVEGKGRGGVESRHHDKQPAGGAPVRYISQKSSHTGMFTLYLRCVRISLAVVSVITAASKQTYGMSVLVLSVTC